METIDTKAAQIPTPPPETLPISVLMPVYNTKEEYFRAAIESILSQTFTNFELIILNDGSTNNVEEVALSYNDKRIIYKKQEHQRIGKSRNTLIDMAKGKYIVWMDSDDISLPQRLQIQYDYLEKHPDISILGSGATYFKDNEIIKEVKGAKLLRCINYYDVSQGTTMIRKADLDKYNLRYNPEYPILEDPEFYSRAFRVLKGEILDQQLIKYRVVPNSLSHKSENKAMLRRYRRIIHSDFLEYLTADLKTQQRIANALKETPLLKKIFSCTNKYFKRRKYKQITILGFQIFIKTNTVL